VNPRYSRRRIQPATGAVKMFAKCTRLWPNSQPRAMAPTLALHDTLLQHSASAFQTWPLFVSLERYALKVRSGPKPYTQRE
jgi:hypothetical protein